MAIPTKWMNVPGAPGYQVRYDGQVRRIYKNGRIRIIKPYIRKHKWLTVGINGADIKKEIPVHKLMALVFDIEGEGDIVYHKNGSILDNHVNNLRRGTKQEVGKLFGAQSGRKPVVRIDIFGGREYYSSARHAARENYCSYQTISDSCHGRTKSNCTGYDFQWA